MRQNIQEIAGHVIVKPIEMGISLAARVLDKVIFGAQDGPDVYRDESIPIRSRRESKVMSDFERRDYEQREANDRYVRGLGFNPNTVYRRIRTRRNIERTLQKSLLHKS